MTLKRFQTKFVFFLKYFPPLTRISTQTTGMIEDTEVTHFEIVLSHPHSSKHERLVLKF